MGITVREILAAKGRQVVTTTADTPLLEAMAALIDHQISCLPVVDDNEELIGIVSDKDIFRCAFNHHDTFTQRRVGEIMTRELIVGLETDSVDYIAGMMTTNRIRHIPIVEGRRLVGLVSLGDVVKTQIRHIEIENRYLRDYIEGKYPG